MSVYNFFVTAQQGAWDKTGYEFDRSRFLEFTPEEVAAGFQDLKTRQLETLKKLPCLFAYEGEYSMRVGKLIDVKPRGRALFIEFEMDPNIPEIPYDNIRPLKTLLDIRDWEMTRTHWAVKDEDLFDRLRNAQLIPTAAQPSIPEPASLPDPEPSDEKVDSVGAFITAVLAMEKGGKEIFYRGHSNKPKYRLEPSLFRKNDSGDYVHLSDEHRLYRELLVSNSGDFQGDVYSLDRLVRMQHYSLPTRLLDITSNPLIALYFACCSNTASKRDGTEIPEIPGEVIVFSIDRDRVKYFDSDTASCLANLARMPDSEKNNIDYSLSDTAFNEQTSIKRLLHFVKEEKPFFEPRIVKDHLRSVLCVKGKRSNDRISFQAGAFLLFGHGAVLDELATPEIGVKRIEVVNKRKMLEDLDQLNINERTVFPYIENSARYIAQRYSFKAQTSQGAV